jgi:hypothetical protein
MVCIYLQEVLVFGIYNRPTNAKMFGAFPLKMVQFFYAIWEFSDEPEFWREKKSENASPIEKLMVPSESAPRDLSNEWSCQYVSTILYFWGNFCVPPLMTEVTISP